MKTVFKDGGGTEKIFLLRCEKILTFHTKILDVNTPKICIVAPSDMLTPTTQSAVSLAGEIAINRDFIELFLQNPLQLDMVLAHEIRHVYQIEKNKNFLQQYSDNHENLTDYNSQEAEIDAWAYSFAYMGVYYRLEPQINVLSEEVKKQIRSKAKELATLFMEK